MKKTIIIWGGNNKELTLETLDSHASVNAFFLSKYLREYFDIINITNIDNAEEILEYKNIHAILSTSQYGFTNRIIKKGKIELYEKIKSSINGYLCSIADNNNIGIYYEDILFCVRPINKLYSIKNKKLSINRSLKEIRTGWCAEPEIFCPNLVPEKTFNVFIDHSPYSAKSINVVKKFYKALKKIHLENKDIILNVYHQNNNGIEKWDFDRNTSFMPTYNREIKVPYLELIKVYKTIHFFCFTHKESAGLSGIEAAMAGAKLYVPRDYLWRTFIKKDLLDPNIEYKILAPFSHVFYRQFKKDIKRGIKKVMNHYRLKETDHTWEKAAKIIYNSIK